MLADAMVRAQNMGAVWLIDLSSLTYACRAEYGDFVTGIFSNDKETGERFRFTAQGLGEPAFALPLDHIYHDCRGGMPEKASQRSTCISAEYIEKRRALDPSGRSRPFCEPGGYALHGKGSQRGGYSVIAAFVEKELPGEFMM